MSQNSSKTWLNELSNDITATVYFHPNFISSQNVTTARTYTVGI